MNFSRLVRPTLVLSAVASIWWLGVVISGRYMSTVLNFWIVLAIQLVGLAVILMHTAPVTVGYVRQVANGVAAFSILALVLSVVTYVGWAFIAPEYADAAVEMARQNRLAAGQTVEEMRPYLETVRGQFTPIRQSSFVIPGTIFTGLVGSLLLAFPLKGRGSASSA